MDTITMHTTMATRGHVGARVRTVVPGVATVAPTAGALGVAATGFAGAYCVDHGTGRSPWPTTFANTRGTAKCPARHLGPPST